MNRMVDLETRACPYPGCVAESSALIKDDGHQMVTWCGNGHVTIFEDNWKKQIKNLVHTFEEV